MINIPKWIAYPAGLWLVTPMWARLALVAVVAFAAARVW